MAQRLRRHVNAYLEINPEKLSREDPVNVGERLHTHYGPPAKSRLVTMWPKGAVLRIYLELPGIRLMRTTWYDRHW